MPRYAISLDTDSVTELASAPDLPASALRALARDAHVTFTDIAIIPAIDTHFFGATTRFAFTATHDDVLAYCAYYDADLYVIESLDA